MNKVQETFWEWTTRSALRLGAVLLVAHAIVTAPSRQRKKARHG